MHIIVALIIIFIFQSAKVDEITYADSHGPISLMGEHIHKKNEYMFSYRLMKMQMNDLQQGYKKISLNKAMSSPNGAGNSSGTYMNAPDRMNMEMHMFGAMYAPSDSFTLMFMGSYNLKEMTQKRMPMSGGSKFDVNSSGFGDVRTTLLFKTHESKDWKNHLGFGLSLPTGSINKRDTTPMSNDTRLGYGMQNGTGTYDSYIFFNNLNEFGKFKLGEQIYFKTPVSGKNDYGYKYGKEIDLNIWMSYRFFDFLSSSFKVNYHYKGKINGSDNEMNKRMSPALDSYNHGSQKINLGFGINFISNQKFLKNNRLAIELIIPVYQKYKGIQMSENFRFVIGWQY